MIVILPDRGILKMLFNLELSFWLWKSMNQIWRKRNAAQFNFLRVIVASCLIIARK